MAAKIRAAFFLLCWPTFVLEAAWTVDSSQRETARVGAIEHSQIHLHDAMTGERAELHLAIFSTKSCTIRIIDQPAEPRSDLAQVMAKERSVAGVNGGYFDPADAPVGLLISDGKLIAPLRKARLLTGVAIVANARFQILRFGEYSSRRNATEALQCGPFLVDLGMPVSGLEYTRTARRTFVLTALSDRAAIGFCSDVTLAQLAKILATANLAPELKIQRALNLDGGSSSAFWFAGERGAFSINEQKTVRDFLAIVPK